MKKYWSIENQKKIANAIHTAENANQKAYAVFDADNTVWKYDLVEALLAWMSASGLITIEKMDPSMLPYALREHETPMSYYDYLCDIDHSVGYLWAAQVFAGYQLQELRAEVRAMWDHTGMIQAPMPKNQWKEIPVAQIYPARKS